MNKKGVQSKLHWVFPKTHDEFWQWANQKLKLLSSNLAAEFICCAHSQILSTIFEQNIKWFLDVTTWVYGCMGCACLQSTLQLLFNCQRTWVLFSHSTKSRFQWSSWESCNVVAHKEFIKIYFNYKLLYAVQVLIDDANIFSHKLI